VVFKYLQNSTKTSIFIYGKWHSDCNIGSSQHYHKCSKRVGKCGQTDRKRGWRKRLYIARCLKAQRRSRRRCVE